MRNGLMVLSTFAMLMSGAFAGDVTLHLKSDTINTGRALFRLGSVAKIQQDLKLTLSNGGFTSKTIDAADPDAVAIETFGFGSSVGAIANETGAEALAINPLATDIVDEVCGNGVIAAALPYHMHQLVHGSLNATGAAVAVGTSLASKAYCEVSGPAGGRMVAAGFTTRYKLDAAGGMKGVLEIYIDNGVDKTLGDSTSDPEREMITALVADESSPVGGHGAGTVADASILLGGSGANRLLDQGQGQISYKVGFALDGAQAGPEKRVSFSHELSLDI